MPNSFTYPRLLGVATVAIAVIAMFPSTPAHAAQDIGEIRVVTKDGSILAEHVQYTRKTKIRTDPNAECFGEGTGGSGEVYTDNKTTAATQLFDASRATPGLRPIGVSDYFSFGLAICEIGGVDPSPDGFWYVKQNHKGATVGADQLDIEKGDSILWWEIADFNEPTPVELELQADPRTTKGNIRVRVVKYKDNGRKSAAGGASVTGAAKKTNRRGYTTVSLSKGITDLRATKGKAIPSNTESVCMASRLSQCAPAHDKRITGTSKADKISDTKGNNVIRASRGDDRIRIVGGGRDRVLCGTGKDLVIVKRGDRDDRIGRSCEKVVTR